MLDLIKCKCANDPLQIQLPELKQLLQLCFCEVPHALLVYLAKAIWLQGDAISSHVEKQRNMIVDCRQVAVQLTIHKFVHVGTMLCD